MPDTIIVMGDSHAHIFLDLALASAFPDHAFDVVIVGGATVSGLPNPNAATQARPRFVEAMTSTCATTAILLLGEVDTGFVIWYRAEKYGATVDAMLEIALANYQSLLLEARDRFRVIAISAPLPTIRDGTSWGEVANARREVTATQRDRTLLTIRFNAAMARFCEAHDMGFIALDDESVGEDGIVHDHLRNPDESDHHYDPGAYAAMLTPHLRTALAASLP